MTRTWYDEVNRVISTTTNYDPNRPQNAGGEHNLVTTYGYDQTGQRILITDTLGRVTRNYYDAAGRLISTTANYLPGFTQNYLNQYNLNTIYGYDASGRQYLVTNTLGLANHTAYDPVTGRPLTTTTNYADGVFNPAVPDEDVAQSMEYDAHGNPYLRRDAAGRVTRTWYDELNRAISVTVNYQPDRPQNDEGQYNLVTTYGYDELGNRAWVTDTLGHVTWTQYDALNRAVTVTQNYLPGQPANYLGQYNLITVYEYDALGRQSKMQDARGTESKYEYDGLGRTIAQIDPLEQRTTFAYDVLGNRTVMTDAAQHVTRFEYDTLNRLITTTRYLNNNPVREVTHYDAAGNRTETIDARGQATTYGYDALGRTIAITDAHGHVTTFAYDALGRRTAQTDALQHTTVFTPDRLGRQIATADPLGNTTRYGYDVSGNRVVLTDANQIVTRYEYDTLDRLSAVIENYTGGAQTTDRDVRTTYAYDPPGNRTVMTNARGYPTTYEYDALNRMSQMQDARGKTTEYVYDAVGNRTVMTDANGEVTLYAYDALNRQTTITYTADATTVRFVYDAIGNRTAMTDAIGTTQYVFDDLNRLTSVTDPFAQTVGYAYDAAGNRTHVIYPDGKVVTTTYDAAGLLTGVIDWNGQTTAYAYDAANRLITATLPNQVQTIYTYDDANRLIHLSHTRLSDDTLLADYEFALDNVGNRVQVSEAMEYPGDSQAAALPPTLADAIVEAITGHRAPGLSAPMVTGTLASLFNPLAVSSVESQDASRSLDPLTTHELLSHRTASTQWAPVLRGRAAPEAIPLISNEIASPPAVARNDVVLAPLAGPGDIFADGFESGNFTAWSAAVTNTGRLSVTTTAARWGAFGMRALITSTTAMYVRDDTPLAEPRYRARFYFSPNSLTMANNNAHELFIGRNVTGTNVFTVQLSYASSTYRLMAQAVNDSTGISSTAWYAISNTWHFIEIDWKASTSTTARNGYITLWIDGVQKESKTGIDNDTRRVDEVRLGPLSGLDSGTTGTEYFDAFESRRDTYIGLVALADFTASPVSGTAPLTVTFTNTSQPTATLTAYLWNFGDGYTSTITNPVHSYLPGYYTVTLTAWNGVYSDTITRTRLITATVKADFSASPMTGTAPLTVTFTNTSQPSSGITSYLWNFGDGVTSTITNPVKTYAPGYYTVTLTAWSGSLKDVITQTRLITATIKAGFTANPVEGNIPLTVTFTNTSQPIDGASTFSWNFGDGTSGSTVVHPSHVYTRVGTFGVTLTAQSGVMQDVLARAAFITTMDDTPVSGDFVVAPGVGTGLDSPAVAYNPTRDEYLVVWVDLNHNNNIPLYGQRVSRTGHLLGASFAITSGLDLNAWEPRVAYDPVNDQYLVVWPGDGIAGRLISGAGTPGASFALSDPAATNWSIPQVAYNATAQAFLITWWSEVDDITTLWGQRVSNGSLIGAAFSLAEDIDSESPTALTVNPASGAWLATWSQSGLIVARSVSSSGVPASSTWTIATLARPVYDLASSASAAGDYLITWRTGQDTNGNIVGQRVAADGSLLGSSIAIASGINNIRSVERLALAYRAASDDFFVVWQHDTGESYDLHGAYVTAQGAGVVSPIEIITAWADQISPAVVYADPDNTYLLTWRDERTFGIYARRWQPPIAQFSAAPLQGLTPLTVTFTNLTTPTIGTTYQWDFGDGVTSTSVHPTHVYTTLGFLMPRLTASQPDGLHVASLSAALQVKPAVGEAIVVRADPATNDGQAALAYNPIDRQYLTVWSAWHGPSDIYARRIDSSGLPVGQPVKVNAASGDHQHPAVAVGHGVYLVVWEDHSTHTVRGQIVEANGVLSGTAFTIGNGGEDNHSPAIDYNPVSDEFLVVWVNYADGENDLWAQRVAPSGQPVGNVIVMPLAMHQLAPAVAHDAAGNYLVAFMCDEWPDQFAICVQPIAGDGSLIGTATKIYGAPTNSGAPALVYNPATNEFLVAWVESAGGPSDEVYAQRVRSDGTLVGNRLTLGAQTSGLYRPAVGYHAASNAVVVVWSDQRAGNWDAYARTIEADGTLLEDPVALEATAANQTEVTISRAGADFDLFVLYTDDGSGSPDLYGERYIPPATLFSAAPLSGTRPLTVTFTDRSTIPNPLTWRWDFGDGMTSTLPSPVHTYAQGGRYLPRLSVSNGLYTKTYTLPDSIAAFAPHRTVINYTYDGLYRLTKAASTGALTTTFEYAYDPVGNRTAQTVTITSTQVTNYVYDPANRLTGVNGQAYTWDDNGNLVSDGAKTYTYNQANQLTNISGAGLTWSASYNSDGARLRQVIAGVPTTYTQDLAAPLPVVLQSKTGANAMQYVYALGTRPLAQYAGAWEYLLADALGSVRQIVDGSGNVTLAESYEPYGSVLSSTGTASSIFGYSGEQVDTYIKLLFLRSRYYRPETGGFLSKDVWQGDYTRPQSLNGWGYVEGDPINHTDPTGWRKYRIWASAFIPWDKITFPYPYGVKFEAQYPPYIGYRILSDPNAQWHGDNRSFATGGVDTVFNKQYSARVWHEVVIDTADINSPIKSPPDAGIGRTIVWYTDEDGIAHVETDIAPNPEKPTVSVYKHHPALGCFIHVKIEASVGNPLFKIPVVRDFNHIDYSYTLEFFPEEGKLYVTGEHDSFPAHELYVAGLDQPALVTASPSGPFYTPADLMNPFLVNYYGRFDILKEGGCECQ